jgi:hypothetical protein
MGALSRCRHALPRASLPFTCPAPFPAISSHRRSPRELPTPATLGVSSPVHATRYAPERKKKGGEEEEDESFKGAMPAPPRGPEAARGVPGHREAKDLADASPLLPLPALPSSSSPHRAFLHRHLHLLVAQTVGERITVLSSCGARPSSRGHLSSLGCSPSCPKHRRASALALVMAAFEPGWESISCRCCCRPRRARNPLADLSLAIPGSSLGRRVAAAIPSRRRGLDVGVHRTFLGTHPCTHAPTHTHVYAYARQGKVVPFSSLPSEPSSPAFRSLWTEESPPGEGFPPRKCKRLVAVEFACLVASKSA